MELREKAKSWLEKYKSGDPYAVRFGLEDVAAVVAEYLHESGDSDSYREKYDKCRAELEKELERNANLEQFVLKLVEVQHVTASTLDQYEKELTSERIKALRAAKVELLHEDLVAEQDKTAELEKRNKELEFQLAGASNRVLRLEGENSALRFAVRCNGMSGAEVKA